MLYLCKVPAYIGDQVNVTCKCGWVSFAVTKEYAENQVKEFNAWFETQSQETKDNYGGVGSDIHAYACQRCGNEDPGVYRPAVEGDCPDGCTIGPVICDILQDTVEK